MQLLKARDLALGYNGQPVITGLNFTLSEGDFLSVVGENGSGKTTLVRALLGLERPLGGSLELADSLRGGIGYMAQASEGLRDFPASVFEVVSSGLVKKLGARPFLSAADRREIQQTLELLGIAHLKRRPFGQLSGGERQRVLVARALCACNGVLLLDEATAGLDVLVTAELFELLRNLNAQNGVTIISVCHDIAAAVRYSSSILHLGDGGALYFGPAAGYAESAAGRLFLRGGNADV